MSPDDPYRHIVEHFPDGIVFVYEGGDELRYTFVGGEGLSEVGLTKEGLEGTPVADGRPPEIRDTIRARYRRALEGERVTFETEAEGRHYRIRLLPVSDGDGDGDGVVATGIGIAQDITEQVAYREELQRQNERLEGFTDLVFHDIRNPLNVAQERLELLRADCDSDHVEPIADALDRIESLTDEEPPVAAGTGPDAETVDLDAVARAAWQNVATKDAGVRVEVDGTVRASGDDLRRLFENLYRNAVDHGGDDVTVTVGSLEAGFYVADDGRGLPDGDVDDIFDRGVSTGDSGSGLGLFIVERVAERHDWGVTATTSEAGGARFEFAGIET